VSDGEVDVGARAIAVPIMNKNRRAIAALSIEGPALRMTDDKLDTYIKLLFKEQEIIHQNL
jgi:DNA-binding IclR family transcriptional regulator